ncbi:MAG: hypothetical protein C4519_27745 [Desulfobacteraceae bacterium]|nr:MAG: hypothetical protein C4519_27745 [Desulfobacteraceae bacterium]
MEAIELVGDLEKKITQIVSEILEMDEQEIWEKRKLNFFKDMGLDSLLALEIVASIEKRFRIEIAEERLRDVSTLEQTISLVEELLA